MINFRCRCSFEFSVPEDQAGESYQCPSCGLLVDVPTLEDRHSLQDDGTFILQESTPNLDTHPARDTPHIVARHDQKDRRLSLEEFLKIGTTEDDLLQIKGEVRPGVPKHPKYDPITGELILPIDVKQPAGPTRPVLVAQPAVLGYQQKKTGDQAEPSVWTPFVAMFRLPNVLVCAIVALIQTLTMTMLVMGMFNWIMLILVLPMILVPIAHFASVVDETGPTRNDEIPRPLRGGNIYEDYLLPLVQVTSAFAIACMPIVLFNKYGIKLHWSANAGLLIMFFTVVPALLLTIITSGAVNNLLPQRSLSVISAAGWDYAITTASGFIGTVTFFLCSLFAANLGIIMNTLLLNPQGPAALPASITGLPYWLEVPLTLPIVYVGCYAMHVFSWQLGILYRKHHSRFAWVLQKHDSSVRTDTIALLQQQRQKEAEARTDQARKNMAERAATGPHMRAR